jgi:hypothetical protein
MASTPADHWVFSDLAITPSVIKALFKQGVKDLPPMFVRHGNRGRRWSGPISRSHGTPVSRRCVFRILPPAFTPFIFLPSVSSSFPVAARQFRLRQTSCRCYKGISAGHGICTQSHALGHEVPVCPQTPFEQYLNFLDIGAGCGAASVGASSLLIGRCVRD